MDVDLPAVPQAALDTVQGYQPQPDAINARSAEIEARFALLDHRLTLLDTGFNKLGATLDRVVAVLESLQIKENSVVEEAKSAHTTLEEAQTLEQVAIVTPAAQSSGPHLHAERHQGREATPEMARPRPMDRQSLKEHLRLGSFRPEDLVLLAPVGEGEGSDADSDRGFPSDLDVLLQDPTTDNRQDRRDAFCRYFTIQRFTDAWSEYLSIMAEIRPSSAARVVENGEGYVTWLLSMAKGGYWPDLMRLHYDIHEEQDELQRTPGIWIVSSTIIHSLGAGALRVRRRLPRAGNGSARLNA